MTAKPVPEFAKSSIYVARHQITAVDGDLGLAREYLERVASSNSEEVGQAAELLKKVKSMIMTKAQTGTETQTIGTSEPPERVPHSVVGEGPTMPID